MPPKTVTKSKTTVAPSSFPSKITKSCTLVHLREEATFRGLDLGTVPLSKTTLLDILGEGSTSAKAAAEKVGIAVKKKAATKPVDMKKDKKNIDKVAVSAISPKSIKSEHAKKPPKKKEATSTKTASAAAESGATKKPKEPRKPQKVAAAKTPAPDISVFTAASPKKKAADAGVTHIQTEKKTPPSSSKKPPASASKQTKLNFPVVAEVVSSAIQFAGANTNAAKKRKEPPTTQPLVATKVARKVGVPVAPMVVSSSWTIMANNNFVAAAAKPAPVPALFSNAHKQDVLPRINKKMSMQQLKDEAVARQIHDPKKLPKNKADLLHFLVDGSIHIAETPTYKAYQELLHRVQNETPALYQQSLANRRAEERKKEERRDKERAKALALRAEENAKTLALRKEEMARQESLHRHSFPLVHPHPLALTKDLTMRGNPRDGNCDCCHPRVYYQPCMLYTCEACDWDICVECFKLKNMTSPQIREFKEKERIKREQQRREQERRWQEMEQESIRKQKEEELRWNAQKQFKAVIINPDKQNENVDAKGHKFVVWCSDGYHSESPIKHFDTSWKTATEANDRGRYLFFWKNPWGISPDEVGDPYDGFPEPTMRDGLATYTVTPPDSTCWTVGVVPSVAFRHLPEASTEKHTFDDSNDDEDILILS